MCIVHVPDALAQYKQLVTFRLLSSYTTASVVPLDSYTAKYCKSINVLCTINCASG